MRELNSAAKRFLQKPLYAQVYKTWIDAMDVGKYAFDETFSPNNFNFS